MPRLSAWFGTVCSVVGIDRSFCLFRQRRGLGPVSPGTGDDGCRLGWCEVKPDRLALIDAKTEPRHVLLGEAAGKLLDSLAAMASGEWAFPGKSGDEPLSENALYWFWRKTRDAAWVVADARLHDLRHAHASHVVMNGGSLYVAERLLGHRRASTANRYVHLDDAPLSQAAERVTLAIVRKLHRSADHKAHTSYKN